MNISLPDELKQFVDEQVASGSYGTSSEFMRQLLRHEKDRRHLRGLIVEGMASPVAFTLTDENFEEYFDGLRQQA